MKFLLKGTSFFYLNILLGVFCWAENSAAIANNSMFNGMSNHPSQLGLKLQVIQDQFLLNSTNIKSATLVSKQDGSFTGLEVELKKFAVKELERLTNNGIGLSMNLVINNRIISSPHVQTALGKKFLIASISREEAQAFISLLNNSRHQQSRIPIVR